MSSNEHTERSHHDRQLISILFFFALFFFSQSNSFHVGQNPHHSVHASLWHGWFNKMSKLAIACRLMWHGRIACINVVSRAIVA